MCFEYGSPKIVSIVPVAYTTNSDGTTFFGGGDSHLVSFSSFPVSIRVSFSQGWAPDFIPRLVASATEAKMYDNVMTVDGRVAMATCKEMAQKEGIFSGTSGGGVLSAALELAKDAPVGTTILALIPDTGERYLSTPLFEDVPADMTDEEKKIAASTPSNPPPAPGLPDATPEAVDWVKEKIGSEKVVTFMLKYCEFCWTLTGLLDALGVEYTRIDIDSFEYAKDNMGNKYRSALQDMTDCKTFPQFFIDGKFIGGAVDACMMWKKDELRKVFEEAGITGGNDNFNNYKGDPFEFLPKWMTQNPLRSK